MSTGISATSPITTTERVARDVEPRRTPASPAELRAAIGTAYRRVTGQTASGPLLDTLTAQASLETGRGAQMYNYNFGGIKAAGHRGDTANYLTHEVIGGHDVTVRQGFRAYASIDAGAEDYVRVLSHTFGSAMASAQIGDLHGFAHALKQAGYYTAPEAQYAAALQSLGARPAAIEPAMQPVPSMSALADGTAYSASGDLSRVLDALSSSALRIAATDRDDS